MAVEVSVVTRFCRECKRDTCHVSNGSAFGTYSCDECEKREFMKKKAEAKAQWNSLSIEKRLDLIHDFMEAYRDRPPHNCNPIF